MIKHTVRKNTIKQHTWQPKCVMFFMLHHIRSPASHENLPSLLLSVFGARRYISYSVLLAATGCGGQLVAGSAESVLTSPGFPNNYTNNLNCSWIIRASAGHRISLRFVAFDLQRRQRRGLVNVSVSH